MDEVLRELFEHNAWGNRRIVARAGAVASEAWQADSPPLRPALVHMLNAERIWHSRLTTGEPPRSGRLKPEDFPTAEAFAEAWAANEAAMRAWLYALSPADLEELHPSIPPRPPRPMWKFLMHVFLHGAQHRAEVAEMLTAMELSPGELDFLEYASEAP